MPPTRVDYLQAVKKESPKAQGIAPALLEVAAVKAAELTNHPGWDRFLEQLQYLLNQAEKDAALWTSNTVNAYKDEDMRFAQRETVKFAAQVELLKKIMQLPSEIVKEFHAAQSR